MRRLSFDVLSFVTTINHNLQELINKSYMETRVVMILHSYAGSIVIKFTKFDY